MFYYSRGIQPETEHVDGGIYHLASLQSSDSCDASVRPQIIGGRHMIDSNEAENKSRSSVPNETQNDNGK